MKEDKHNEGKMKWDISRSGLWYVVNQDSKVKGRRAMWDVRGSNAEEEK